MTGVTATMYPAWVVSPKSEVSHMSQSLTARQILNPQVVVAPYQLDHGQLSSRTAHRHEHRAHTWHGLLERAGEPRRSERVTVAAH